MPRRDGFPTNPELVEEFTEASRLTYVAAYETVLAGQLDKFPHFHGKPLSAVPLIAYRNHMLESAQELYDSSDINVVEKELLEVRPVSPIDADAREGHLTLRDLPQENHEAYAAMVERIGNLHVSDDIAVATALEPGGVVADYTATLRSGRVRHIGTLKERPAKQSIVSGKFFAEDMHQFLASPAALRKIRLANAVLRGIGEPPLMDAFFTLSHVRDLPLNGYEPESWLNDYLNEMSARALRHRDTLERLEALGAPQVIIDHQESLIGEYESAARRALRCLDAK